MVYLYSGKFYSVIKWNEVQTPAIASTDQVNEAVTNDHILNKFNFMKLTRIGKIETRSGLWLPVIGEWGKWGVMADKH